MRSPQTVKVREGMRLTSDHAGEFFPLFLGREMITVVCNIDAGGGGGVSHMAELPPLTLYLPTYQSWDYRMKFGISVFWYYRR